VLKICGTDERVERVERSGAGTVEVRAWKGLDDGKTEEKVPRGDPAFSNYISDEFRKKQVSEQIQLREGGGAVRVY
jgi:hypothetical protein